MRNAQMNAYTCTPKLKITQLVQFKVVGKIP